MEQRRKLYCIMISINLVICGSSCCHNNEQFGALLAVLAFPIEIKGQQKFIPVQSAFFCFLLYAKLKKGDVFKNAVLSFIFLSSKKFLSWDCKTEYGKII